MAELFSTARLRAVEAAEGDLPFIIAMEEAPANRSFIWQGTREEHLAEIADPDHILLVFRDGAGPVGYALIRLDRRSLRFELRRIAIDKKGVGYGREAMLGLIDYAFNALPTNRFWLDVYPDNLVGIRLYESLGFRREGTLRENYKSERGWLDQTIYSILRRDLPDLPKR